MHVGKTAITSHAQQQAGCSLSFPINELRPSNETCVRFRARFKKIGVQV